MVAIVNQTTFETPFGGYTPSADLITYNALVKKYSRLADITTEKLKVSLEECEDLDELVKKVQGIGEELLRPLINETVSELVNLGLYELTTDDFFECYYHDLYKWEEACQNIEDRYFEIVLEQDELDKYRVARRESRSRFVGGGYGVTGAVTGMLQAGAANMAWGAVHGTFNLAGKLVSSVQVNVKKKKIFDDPEVQAALLYSFHRSVMGLQVAFYNVCQDKLDIKAIKEVGTCISGEQEKKSSGLLQNLELNRIPADKIKSVLMESFENNPYNKDIYLYALKKFGDKYGSLSQLAEYFGFSIDEDKIKIVDAEFPQNAFENEENCISAFRLLKDKADEIGLGNLSPMQVKLKEKIEAFELEARTLNGKVYQSREEVALIKAVDADFDGSCTRNEEACLAARDRLRVKAAGLGLSQLTPAQTKINEAILKYDLLARTVDGVLYDTREEAQTIRDSEPTEVAIVSAQTLGENSATFEEREWSEKYKKWVNAPFYKKYSIPGLLAIFSLTPIFIISFPALIVWFFQNQRNHRAWKKVSGQLVESDTGLRLKKNESAQRNGIAGLRLSGKIVLGTLHLTNQRLAFISNQFSSERVNVDVDLLQIDRVEFSGFLLLKVHTLDGSIHDFRLFKSNGWLDSINESIAIKTGVAISH